MAILVRKDDKGSWQRWTAVDTIEQYISKASLHYYDGRIVEIDTDPYPVNVALDPIKISSLVDSGVWTQADLDPYAIKIATPFMVPDGKVMTGDERFVENQKTGDIQQEFDVVDEPPPPPPPTDEEKLLATTGLTVADLKKMLS